jgi:formate-dependent nitrite reductase cytochrome c552 subunit
MRPLAIAGIVAAVVIVFAGAGTGLWLYHEQPEFCANLCHIMQPYEDAWASSDWEANTHAQKDIACLDCHEPTIKQQVEEVTKYLSKDFKTPLRERKMPQAKCLSCKEHDSYPALVGTTADWKRNPHNSHWGEMECVLCHNQHRPNVLYCTQCHNDLILPEGWERSSGS